MKIVHLTPDLHFAIKFVLPVVAYQQRVSGADVVVVTYANEYQTASDLWSSAQKKNKDVAFVCINLKVRLRFWQYATSMIKLLRQLRRLRPTLVVSHTSLDSCLPLLLARFFTKARCVYFNHGVTFLGYGQPWRFFFRVLEWVNLRSAHQILTVSESMRSCLQDLAPPHQPLLVVSPGSACGIEAIAQGWQSLAAMRLGARLKLGLPMDECIVLYVGRAVKRKGFFDLLQAWKLIGESHSTTARRLMLVGPSESDLERIRPSDLPSKVQVVGYQSDPTPFYLASDVLCIPSYHEGFGYGYLEASAAGCVPICADIPGPTDFVRHGQTGLVCRAGDQRSIADSIKQLMTDEALCLRLAQEAFTQSQRFERERLLPAIHTAIVQGTALA